MTKHSCSPQGTWLIRTIVVTVLLAPGCGQLGNTLSGGSVPLGGRRTIHGKGIVPKGTPASGSVTVRALPGGGVLASTTTDSSGAFSAADVPVSAPIEVVIADSSGATLKVAVPRTVLSGGSGSIVDVGTLTAATTVAAEAVELEVAQNSDYAEQIVESQVDALNTDVTKQNQSVDVQEQEIDNGDVLVTNAKTTIVSTANDELESFVQSPHNTEAARVVDGLLGVIDAAHGRSIRLTPAQRTDLITAATAGQSFSVSTVTAALQTAGFSTASTSGVQTASQAERGTLPALAEISADISPFEALLLAADPASAGGLELNQATLDRFLTRLLHGGFTG